MIKTHRFYSDYGKRGITICERWNDFSNFLADMGIRPPGLTLERIDNDRGYSPENCRWASRREQGANKRNNRLLTINGETHYAAEWNRLAGFKRGTIGDRLRRGWPPERLLEPIHPKGVANEIQSSVNQ